MSKAGNEVHRVLVVGNDEITLSLISYRLIKEGFAVDAVASGSAAIEKLHHHEYGAILVDLLMPRLDGFGVLHFITESKPHLRPNVMIMMPLGDEHSAPSDGTYQTINLPIDYSELVTLIRGCVEQSRSHAAETWFAASAPLPIQPARR